MDWMQAMDNVGWADCQRSEDESLLPIAATKCAGAQRQRRTLD